MRKILRFLMLVLMATWGAESYAECIQIKAAKVTDNAHTYTDGDITISITAGVEDETYWKGLKRKHRDKTVSNWDVGGYTGASSGDAIKIPVASDFTVSCKDGYIDYILFSFNNGHDGLICHSEYWSRVCVADGTNTKGNYYHTHDNSAGNVENSWWGGYGAGSSSVTFYDDRTTADEGDAQTTGILWLYVFYHKKTNITQSPKLTDTGRLFCNSDTTVYLSRTTTDPGINNWNGVGAMYYTVDGSDPTTSSSTYGSGIKLDQTRTIKVMCQAKLKASKQGGDAGSSDFGGFPDYYYPVSDVVTVGTITQYWPVSTESGSHKENNKTKYYATFCHEHYMKVPSGCTAYTYTLKDGAIKYLTASKLYDVGAVIPPNTPVIVQSDSPIKKKSAVRFENPLNNTAGNDPDANRTRYFKGNGTGSAKTVSGDIYFLMRYKTNELRFMRYSSNVCPAHACYLDLSSSSAKNFVFQFPGDDETTGISVVTTGNQAYDENAPMYNTAGQRVGASYKGIVIQNGRKFVKR